MSPTPLNTGFLSEFQTQLTNFEQFAQHDFPLSNLVSTQPASQDGTQPASVQPASFAGTVAKAIIPGAAVVPQIIAIVLGLIAVAGAIYLYRPDAARAAVGVAA